jgi:hypothetical protein
LECPPDIFGGHFFVRLQFLVFARWGFKTLSMFIALLLAFGTNQRISAAHRAWRQDMVMNDR